MPKILFAACIFLLVLSCRKDNISNDPPEISTADFVFLFEQADTAVLWQLDNTTFYRKTDTSIIVTTTTYRLDTLLFLELYTPSIRDSQNYTLIGPSAIAERFNNPLHAKLSVTEHGARPDHSASFVSDSADRVGLNQLKMWPNGIDGQYNYPKDSAISFNFQGHVWCGTCLTISYYDSTGKPIYIPDPHSILVSGVVFAHQVAQ